MEKQKISGISMLHILLEVMLISAFVFFMWGENAFPPENVSDEGTCEFPQLEWVQLLDDKSRVPITVPGECEAKRGQKITVETVFPQNQDNTWVCIRGIQQDITIYVDGELRKEYSTIDTQLVGKTSTAAYVFFEVFEKDAGKTLSIEIVSDSSYAGFVGELYMGDKADIRQYFFNLYGPSTMAAGFMVILSLVVIFYSLFNKFVYKKEVELLQLGNGLLIASSWLIAESRLRQFILPNSTFAVYLGFYMIMLLPYPLSAYINTIQQKRYQKVYTAVMVATAFNFVLATVLQFTEYKDFFETMLISHVIIMVLVVTIVSTIVIDIRNKHIKGYREVALGLLGLTVAGIAEIYMVYVKSSRYNGIALCLGLVFLLLMAVIKTSRDIREVEQEKQIAIAASQSKAKFLANMSHEIRTPINTVIGMNEMILRESNDDKIKEYAVNVKGASQMLLGLINDILDISKIEAGKLEITAGDYKLASMLHDTILGTEGRATQKGLEFKVEVDKGLPSILRGDEIRIKQILNNLLSNAVKYTEKGSVTLSVGSIEREGDFILEIAIIDTGIGIKKEDVDKLFDSFTRLELKKNRYIQGTGLGLSITKQLVELMSGEILVTSEYGSGSCFTVRLPQQIVDDTAIGDISDYYDPANIVTDNVGMLLAPGKKVLVVDDNKMNLKVVKELLKHTQIKLDFASGGNQCLNMTSKKKYDLILMDHMMPEPDGIQTLHILRKDKTNQNSDTTVIVLTANAIEGASEEYLKEGFADYLSKPIEPAKLESLLAKYLG